LLPELGSLRAGLVATRTAVAVTGAGAGAVSGGVGASDRQGV